MNMKLLFFIICIQLSIQSFTQDSLFYYDLKGKQVEPNKAIILGIAREETGGWMRRDYFTDSKKLAQTAHYKDHDFKIKNGDFVSFFANEQLEEKGTYKDNKKNSFFESYFPNGIMHDSCKYINGIPTGICYSWYIDGSLKRELRMDSIGEGEGIVVAYFPNGNISYKGRLLKGMRKAGNWTYYHENGKPALILNYPNLDQSILEMSPALKYDSLEGLRMDSLVEFISAKGFDEQGIEQINPFIGYKKAEFKNGVNGWLEYIQIATYGLANRILNETKVNNTSYIAYFNIDTQGRVTDLALSNKINSSIDKQVSNAFLNAKYWSPAIHNNRKVPIEHSQALIFQNGNP